MSIEENLNKYIIHDFTGPVIVGSVTFDNTILPGGVPQALNEQTIKSKGEIWVIHKYDADPFPSNPHAHNKETGYKLHLGTGELFSSNNSSLNAKISKKNLEVLRAQVKNIPLPH